MNIGNMITKALNRSQLPVADVATRDMALDMLDEVIQGWWHYKKWGFRKSVFNFTTSTNVEEYALNKMASDIVPNSMRGSDPVRMLRFKPATEFFRAHPHTLPSGDPYEYRDGELWGVNVQPSASSVITFSSSLSNYTSGTAAMIYGSRRVIFTGATITLDMVGRWFRVGTDIKRYRVAVLESSSQILLDSPYEGATDATASYAIGDIQQKGIVQGYTANDVIDEEEVQLNGATSVSTTKSFASLIRISKSDKTYGAITATSNGAVVTNIRLDPGETEADFRTIKLYPTPSKGELITYESYSKHPYLYRPTDSPLFPIQYHPLLLLDLYIKIMTEFLEKTPAQDVLARRETFIESMIIQDNDADEWRVKQETEYESVDRNRTNLPENYGIGYDDYSL